MREDGALATRQFRHSWILAALLVAGCGHYEWQRIAPVPGNLAQDEYVCERDSLQVAPVAIVAEEERTKKERRVTTYDANAGNRDSVFYSCMRARGWAHVFVSDERAAAPAVAVAPPPPPPGSPPPPPPLSAPVAAAPAPGPAPALDPSGLWHTDDNESLTIRLQPGGGLQGDYGDGTIAGRLSGHSFEGTWRESSGDRACRRTADGIYWGRLTFQFAPDGRHATGLWGYCDDAPHKTWNAAR
jgi:hypothetical protein